MTRPFNFETDVELLRNTLMRLRANNALRVKPFLKDLNKYVAKNSGGRVCSGPTLDRFLNGQAIGGHFLTTIWNYLTEHPNFSSTLQQLANDSAFKAVQRPELSEREFLAATIESFTSPVERNSSWYLEQLRSFVGDYFMYRPALTDATWVRDKVRVSALKISAPNGVFVLSEQFDYINAVMDPISEKYEGIMFSCGTSYMSLMKSEEGRMHCFVIEQLIEATVDEVMGFTGRMIIVNSKASFPTLRFICMKSGEDFFDTSESCENVEKTGYFDFTQINGRYIRDFLTRVSDNGSFF